MGMDSDIPLLRSYERKERNMLKDKDIRELLFDFLEDIYGKVPIIEEKTMGRSRADLVMITEGNGAEQVIYAHCHGKERFNDSYKGMHNGVKYSLVSGDYLDFKPQLILE